MIEVKNFSKQYGDFMAVNNISFSVEEGSIFAFLGPNGAGKSTTINTLCTILDKTEGKLIINGYDVNKDIAKVRKDIGIVFQESTLDEKLSVEENLRLHCDFYNVPRDEVQERINFTLKLVDLQDWRNSSVERLSGGMKRRVEIARGLVHYPRVLFLDEPTAGLDPQTRANIWDYIVKLQKEKNMTIFLTTHYMDEAEICDKVAIMDHGKIVAFDTPSQLKDQYTSSTLKIKINNNEALEEYLTEQTINYQYKDNEFSIVTSILNETMNIVTKFKADITGLEIHKGTLNDVFLAITGREIRE